MKVTTVSHENGFGVLLNGKSYSIEYPNTVWKDYPDGVKNALIENLAVATTIHLPLLLGEKSLQYSTAAPLFKETLSENMLYGIPSCSNINGVSTAGMVRDFMNIRLEFAEHESSIPMYDRVLDEKAIIPFTFGKDSLLTYALCRELGMETHRVYADEAMFTHEKKHKLLFEKRFSKEFGDKMDVIRHDTGLLRDAAHFGLPKNELGWDLQTTEYSLLMLPFNNHYDAKYTFFGNERSNNDYLFDSEGFICHPSFDQSAGWTMRQNNIIKLMTNNQGRIASLIEPLEDLAVLHLLVHRYGKYSRYLLSCFADNDSGRDHHWCQSCSKCARLFVFLTAVGADVGALGFYRNMFDREFTPLFALFNGSRTAGYDKVGTGRDEQMFAFYLAYLKGARGHLIERFKKEYLAECLEREDELYSKFFGIHESITLPHQIRKPLMSIYEEELCGGKQQSRMLLNARQ
ncbi:MAG: hypothetical protein JW834_00125 [Candidatus Diapherotrites archaeon]|nr:hypothetical protein [Candidatus Diapherotrites archaeon]